ncbi:uncharacterized protein [Ptychodera flava]|uniref:uncharacterized protein n=1 Tax=Ptychodera flava TaxID=63121 RepID=UPI00396A74FB
MQQESMQTFARAMSDSMHRALTEAIGDRKRSADEENENHDRSSAPKRLKIPISGDRHANVGNFNPLDDADELEVPTRRDTVHDIDMAVSSLIETELQQTPNGRDTTDNSNNAPTEPEQVTSASEDDWLSDLAQEFDLEDKKFGPPIGAQLAEIVNKMMTMPLGKDTLKEKCKQYYAPENCDKVVVTKVNEEIWYKVKPETRSRDIKLQAVQKCMVKAMIPILTSTNDLLKSKKAASESDISRLVKQLTDALAFLGQGCWEINQRRRAMIRPDLNRQYQQLCSKQVPITSYLFGDDLPKQVNDIKTTNRVGSKISGYGYQKFQNSTYGRSGGYRGGYQNTTGYNSTRGKNGYPFRKKHFQTAAPWKKGTDGPTK